MHGVAGGGSSTLCEVSQVIEVQGLSKSKPSAPPPPDSVPSSQPPTRADIQSQVDSLNATVSSLAENLGARLDALTASLLTPPLSQLSSQPRLGPDVVEPQPGVTTGTRRTFQALGVHDRTSADHFHAYHPLGQGARAPPMEQSGSATALQPQAAPRAAPPPSASFVLPQPPRYGDPPPQPSTSGWVPSGPPPTGSARDPTRCRSRRLVMRRAMSPLETPPHLVWLTSYIRSARTHVYCRTLRV